MHGFTSIPISTATASGSEILPTLLTSRGLAAYRHESGFQLILYYSPGPLYNLNIVVPTLPVNDGGHPHTLEHLCFLGTDSHPRGYLDALAAHSLASGTNACTSVESTSYTVTTAGVHGMLAIIPVYLEHLLSPRLDEATFASEVYHIREDGTEAGVVFCEMSSTENTEYVLLDRAVRAVLFDGSPLAMDSGGLCKDIRKLTIDEIVAYHATYYHSSRMTAILGGPTVVEQPQSILKAFQGALEDHALSFAKEPVRSPLPISQSSLSKSSLKSLTRKKVHFPSADDMFGSVTLCWRGPPLSHVRETRALSVLLEYLTDNAGSPLNERFVETQNPLSNGINCSLDLYPTTVLKLTFSAVPSGSTKESKGNHKAHEHETNNCSQDTDSVDSEEAAPDLLKDGVFSTMVIDFLSELIAGGKGLPGGIDAIRRIISTLRASFLWRVENYLTETVEYIMTLDVAHHKYGAPLGRRLSSELEILDDLSREDSSFWIGLIRKYFLSDVRAEIIMVPDTGLAKQITERDQKALEKRVSNMGKDRLHKIGLETKEMLESVKAQQFRESDFPTPPDLLSVPRIAHTASLSQEETFFVQQVRVESSFVKVIISWDVSSLPYPVKRCLALLAENVFSMDTIDQDGTVVPYTKVADDISSVTVYAYAESSSRNLFTVEFEALPSIFKVACDRILSSIFSGVITKERVASIAHNRSSEVRETLRDGDSFCALAAWFLSVGQESRARSSFVQLPFLERIAELAGAENQDIKVVELFQDAWTAVREQGPENTFVQMMSRDPASALQTFTETWRKYCPVQDVKPYLPVSGNSHSVAGESELVSLPIRLIPRPMVGAGPEGVGRVIGIPGVESGFVRAYLDVFVPPVHKDWAALEVLCEMLNRVGGPLYEAVRGKGVAYGVSLINSFNSSRLQMSVSDSKAPADAWNVLCSTLDGFRRSLDAETSNVMEEMKAELDMAKRGVFYSLMRARSTPYDLSSTVFQTASLGVPAGEPGGFCVINSVEQVSLDTVKRTFDHYLNRYFSPSGRLVVVTCNPGVVKDVTCGFAKANHSVALNEISVDELIVPLEDTFLRAIS